MSRDGVNASKQAGIMTHYIADVAVFGYMRGCKDRLGRGRHTTAIRGDRAAKMQDFYTMQVWGSRRLERSI